jgi:hypothetical protein
MYGYDMSFPLTVSFLDWFLNFLETRVNLCCGLLEAFHHLILEFTYI